MERTDFEQWRAKEVARLLALVETERRYYQEMIAALPAPVVVLAADESIAYANRAFRQTFGVRGEELRRKTITQILPAQGLGDIIREALSEGHTPPPVVFSRNNHTFRISIVPTRNWDDESEVETLLLIEDLTSAPTGPSAPQPLPAVDVPAVLWRADRESLAFQTVGGAFEELLGYPEERWLSPGFFEERIYDGDRGPVMALYRSAMESGVTAAAEYRSPAATGDLVWCRETIRVRGGVITGVITDITRRKEMEHQLLAAGRVEAIQALAGRMAHDLNNPLMIASGYGEELLEALPAGTATRNDAVEMLAAIKRISGLAGNLNEFSRKHAKPSAKVELNSLLGTIEQKLAKAASTPVEVIPSAESVWTSAHPEQLVEVVLTLASGAHESAQDRTGLTLSWSADFLAEHIDTGAFPPGKYARITLRDDGRGLDGRGRTALFETLLPEKDPASPRSAISWAYMLVREWGGDIAAESLSPHGTAITIYLPWAEPEAAFVAPPVELPTVEVPPPPPPPEPPRETILVVEDEAGIRGLVRKILRRERYQVLEAGSAEEALTISLSQSAPINLLLTDVVLPGLSGPDLARRMYEASPNLKVLYISGYTEDESVRTGEYPPGARFLAKPFTLSALVTTVRETLDEPWTGSSPAN